LKPAPFEYVAPRTVEEASAALRQNNPEGKILAGGQSLLPLLNLRLMKPKFLVDLNGISDLNAIRETPGALSIGAMTRQSKVEHSSLVREPSGEPSSKYARRYHSPSHADLSTASA